MTTATPSVEYLLGDTADERDRLMAQAALLEDEARRCSTAPTSASAAT